MNQADARAPGQSHLNLLDAARVAGALRAAAPALLFGLRLWAAVCLALYFAFWLEFDNAYWAGTSAAVVCQPNLGASLRKGWFRMIGTVVGAVVIVVLTAFFVQSRFGFLFSLALWGAVCCLVATLLRNFAAYGAALAGYTAAIIASDELGAVGGATGDVFILAVTRASEICIGIICAGVVLAGTDFGGTRRRLAVQFAELSAEIARGLAGTFHLAGPEQSETRPIRRDLIRRVIALDPVIDQALGEASDLRPRSPVLYAAVGGLFAALSGWRTAAAHIELLQGDEGRSDAEIIVRTIPKELRQGEATDWTVDPSRMRRGCGRAAQALAALPARTPSLRLLADQTADALIGLRQALDGLRLLTDPSHVIRATRALRFRVPDLLPPLVNAGRAFVTIARASASPPCCPRRLAASGRRGHPRHAARSRLGDFLHQCAASDRDSNSSLVDRFWRPICRHRTFRSPPSSADELTARRQPARRDSDPDSDDYADHRSDERGGALDPLPMHMGGALWRWDFARGDAGACAASRRARRRRHPACRGARPRRNDGDRHGQRQCRRRS